MMSPQEGLNYTKSHGFTYIIDIPYEFLGDCMDTLIGLRESFGVEPKWNKNFESEFDIQGIHVKITSALYYHSYREKAYYHSIANEIEKLISKENPEKSYKQNLMEQPKKNVKGAIRFLLTLGVLVAIWYYVLRKW